MHTWDKKMETMMDKCARESAIGREKALRSQAAQPGQALTTIPKYDLKQKIQATMLEMSPVRRAKQEMLKAKQISKGNFNPVSILAPKRTSSIQNEMLDSYISGQYNPNGGSPRKMDTSKDAFTARNKSLIEKREEA